MATKSDFAQKLLNDLRMKKERMAASQNSSNSNTMAREGQRNYRQTHKGPQNTKATEPVRPNTANSTRRASGSSRLLTAKENTRQLVTYGSGQTSEQRARLPMAFMLALQNGGNYGKLDSAGNSSMLHFLQQIGRTSLDTGTMDRSSSFNKHLSSTKQLPNFSHFHINEISKGVQNLSQILRACSNGLNFDYFSMEVGKELLKGATDLEESLKMLVSLQEASDYMIKPQRNNRITLIDEDENDEMNTATMAEQKQFDLPRFSFDKRLRNSRGNKEVTNTDLKHRLMALTYHEKTPSFHSKQTSADSNSDTHWLPATWGHQQKNNSNSSQSTPEKGRMSNIIAKLMGLEVLPERVDSQIKQKESGARQKEGIVFKTTYTTTKNAEAKTRQAERIAPLSTNNNAVKQDKRVPQSKTLADSLRGENIQVLPQRTSVEAVADEYLHRKNVERAHRSNETSRPEKATSTIHKPQSSTGHSNKIPKNQNNTQEKDRQDSTKHKRQKSIDKVETKERVIKGEWEQKIQQKHSSQEAVNIMQEYTNSKETEVQTEKRNSEQLIQKKQQKTQHENGLQQSHMITKAEVQVENHQAQRRDQYYTKPKVPLKSTDNATKLQKKHPQMNPKAAAIRSSTRPIGAVLSKEKPSSINNEDFVSDKISTETLANENLVKNESPRVLAPQTETINEIMLPAIQKKPTHALATGKKVEIIQTPRGRTTRKINKQVNRRNGTLYNLTRPAKHHNVVSPESRQRKHDETIELEGGEQPNTNSSKEGQEVIKESTKSETSTQLIHTEQQKHNASEMMVASIVSQNKECICPEVEAPLDCNEVSEDIKSEAYVDSSDYQCQESAAKEDPELMSPKILEKPSNGSMEISYPPHQEQKKAPTSWTQELLTENEKHLKEMLIKSPLFLNTAEAHFKLNIPVGILHASDQIYQDKDSKLTIDCAYEIINRKGRRQELSVQPCLKVSISYTKVQSLDDLVKQLYMDFECLKFYGRSEHNECDDAEMLLKMLERDISITDPNISCMWDFGWNKVMFAYVETDEIIKDVGGHMLDELIDEIIREM